MTSTEKVFSQRDRPLGRTRESYSNDHSHRPSTPYPSNIFVNSDGGVHFNDSPTTTDHVISEKLRGVNSYRHREDSQSFTSRTRTQAEVLIRAAPCSMNPTLHAIEQSTTSRQATPSTVDLFRPASNRPLVQSYVDATDKANRCLNQSQHIGLLPCETLFPQSGMSTNNRMTTSPASSNPKSEASFEAPSTPSRWNPTSHLEVIQGPLRAASDGKLVEEQTGDIIHLDTPDHEAQKHYLENDIHASTRRFAIPEMKNGATALDDPRARKPIARVLKNWWTGSSRPPHDKAHEIFMVGDKEPNKAKVEEMVELRRYEGGANIRYTMIKIMKRFWGEKLAEEFGRDWAEKADVDPVVMEFMENYVIESFEGKAKMRDGKDGGDKGGLDSAKKSGWLW